MNALSEFWASADAIYWIGLVISIVISFVLGYATNVLSGPHSAWFKNWVSSSHLRNLMRLGGNEVIIVVPHQITSSDRRLPQVAVEDVLALRNVFETLAELGIKHPKIRHPENLFEPDLKRDIVAIGGSFTNAFTRELLKQPINGDILAFVRCSTNPMEIELQRGNTVTYKSPSYSEPQSSEPRSPSKDVAFILRRPNPRNESCSVLVLAGIRGIGTWGASDHLRKYARALAARVRKDQGDAVAQGFLAVVEVEYSDFDVVKSKVKDVASVRDDA